MAHNRLCENAKNPECNCSGCGGSRHGWPGHLRLAESNRGAERSEFRYRAMEQWNSANSDQTPSESPTDPNERMRAAANLAVADIVDWLAKHSCTTERVREMGDTLSGQVITELDGYVGESRRQELREDLPGHFWCDLLAELAHAASVTEKHIGHVPEYATSAVLGTGHGLGWEGLQRSVVGFALRSIWNSVLPLFGDLGTLVRCLRILAVLICPNPSGHPAVIRHCLAPLRRDVMSEATGGALQETFGTALQPLSAG